MEEARGEVSAKSVRSCRILIVGAGLVGLAVALAIQKAGHEVVILERQAVLGEIGATVQLSSNATRIFQHWGLLEPLEAISTHPEEFILRSFDGTILTTENFGSAVLKSHSVPYLVVRRSAIHRLLREKAEELGVVIRLNVDTVNAKFDFSKPSITLATGETFEADVILGADGERSLCREKMLGGVEPLYSAGELIFRVPVLVSDVPREERLADFTDEHKVNYWLGHGSHVVQVVRDNLVNISMTIPLSPQDEVRPGIKKVNTDELREFFREWDPRFGELLNIAQECSRWPVLESIAVDKWIHPDGKFALVGDAAHAMPPYLAQGACQGFEDAAVLGVFFSRMQHKSQALDILTIYERLRKPRAMEIGRQTRAMRNFFGTPAGPLQEERDRQLKLPKRFEGFPYTLFDPAYHKWGWGYDAVQEAHKAWDTYLRGEWPLTRGMWRVPV